MKPVARYHEYTMPFDGDPLLVAADLARRSNDPYVLFERGGSWHLAMGSVLELVMTCDTVRVTVDHEGRRTEWEEPLGADPVQQAGALLERSPLAGWRAYGWAGFELSYLLHGLHRSDDAGTLLHLVVPEREVELTRGTARLRASRADDLADLVGDLVDPCPPEPLLPRHSVDVETPGADEYRRAVAAAVAAIRAQQLQKVILSRVVPVEGDVDVLGTYVAGRRGNSPARSFALRLGDIHAAGFSPETVVEVGPDGRVVTQPLAGTRALLGDRSGDRERRDELLADPKEVFEHAISVRAACDELEPVCRIDSVQVEQFMTVKERGSVQHLASAVSGSLAAGRTAWDAFAALFPAVTASGLPKAEACSLIRRHETRPRGLYSGAVLMADHLGALDAALVLRSVFQQDGRTWLRAGAGIVAMSTPERELEETCEKLRSVSAFLVPATVPAAFR